MQAAELLENDGTEPTTILIDNVLVSSSTEGAVRYSATLIALDDQALHGGQIFQLTFSGVEQAGQDATYNQNERAVVIPQLIDSAGNMLHSVKLLQAKAITAGAHTVTLQGAAQFDTSITLSGGAITCYVFNTASGG